MTKARNVSAAVKRRAGVFGLFTLVVLGLLKVSAAYAVDPGYGDRWRAGGCPWPCYTAGQIIASDSWYDGTYDQLVYETETYLGSCKIHRVWTRGGVTIQDFNYPGGHESGNVNCPCFGCDSYKKWDGISALSFDGDIYAQDLLNVTLHVAPETLSNPSLVDSLNLYDLGDGRKIAGGILDSNGRFSVPSSTFSPGRDYVLGMYIGSDLDGFLPMRAFNGGVAPFPTWSTRWGGAPPDSGWARMNCSVEVAPGVTRDVIQLSGGRMQIVDGTSDVTALLPTGVESTPDPTLRFNLGQNIPNPFNPSTAIEYSLPLPMHVSLRVYDIQGRRVATLFDGPAGAGRHGAIWSGRDDHGRPLASGVYLYRMEEGRIAVTRKMALLK